MVARSGKTKKYRYSEPLTPGYEVKLYPGGDKSVLLYSWNELKLILAVGIDALPPKAHATSPGYEAKLSWSPLRTLLGTK